ncbi:MAG: class A beta-lactamase-related serine hydrolase [Myxococcales bacterium]|nr:class A beta-lactamase-related serine hydrolase [Myxococcales bacterium]
MVLGSAFVTLLLTNPTSPPSAEGAYTRPLWASELTGFLEEQVRSFGGPRGRLGFRLIDWERGEVFGFADDRPMYLASGVKLAFMIATFRALEEGTLRLDQTVAYTEDDKRDGAIEINPQSVGSQFTIKQLLTWMMRSSDNAASDLLIDQLGLDAIAEALVREGIYGFSPITRLIEVRRGFYRSADVRADDLSAGEVRAVRWTRIWRPQIRKFTQLAGRRQGSIRKTDLLNGYEQFYASGVNHASMKTVSEVFERMLDGKLVSYSASRDMLELMSGARTSTARLLGQLPEGTDVAHKTGSQYLRFCDLGIVFLPEERQLRVDPPARASKIAEGRGSPLIITMCTEGIPVEPAEKLMASAAGRAYQLVTGEQGR